MAGLRDVVFTGIFLFFLTPRISSNSNLPKEINVFDAVGLGSKVFPGVSSTAGQNNKSPAYHFTQKTDHMIASQNAFEEVDKLIHNSSDFIVSAYAKLGAKEIYKNPIVSINSKDGNQLYFLLQISGNARGSGLEIVVTVQTKGGSPKRFEASSSRSLDYTTWHKIAVRIQESESLMRVYVDDSMINVFSFRYTPQPYPKDAQLRLGQVFEVYLENTGEITSRFRGDLQDVKFVRGSPLGDCSKIAKCQCTDVVGKKDCVVDGLKYADGNRWTRDKCNICHCEWGQVICTYTCQVCKDNDQTYMEGETWKSSNDSCQTCKCEGGKVTCSPPVCPKPDCSGKSGDVVTLKGQCCPICKEDQCRGTGKVFKCGCDATCSNYDGLKCQSCTEGCFCPEGRVLNGQGKCMATARCGCLHKGKRYKTLEQYSNSCQFCLCLGGKMHCDKWC